MSTYTSKKTISKTNQYDQRQFVDGGSAIVGGESAMVYPTSVSVFGSPESTVGDITFVTHAPAEVDVGLSNQLSSIMSTLAAPMAPMAPMAPAMPTIPGAAPAKAAMPNYLIYAAVAVAAFLIWRM